MERGVLCGAKREVGVRVLGRVMEVLHPGQMVVRRSKRVALLERIAEDERGAATLGGVKFVWAEGSVRAVKE